MYIYVLNIIYHFIYLNSYINKKFLSDRYYNTVQYVISVIYKYCFLMIVLRFPFLDSIYY